MNTPLIVAGVLMAAFTVLIIIGRRRMQNMPRVEDHQKILKLTRTNFQAQTRNRLVLVDFWADWCAPCRMMAPVLNEVAERLPSDAYVGKVNVEHEQHLAQKHKVRNIPTLVLFQDGKEINRFVGVKSRDFLLKQMRSV